MAADVMPKPDYFAILLGPPRSGKTSLALELAHERAELGRWVFVQDANREAGHLMPSYSSVAQWREAAAAAAAAGEPLERMAAIECLESADELIEHVSALGQQWNVEGQRGESICLVLNEFSDLDKAGSTWMGKPLTRLLSKRRHYGVECIFALQFLGMVPTKAWEILTDCYLFRMPRGSTRRKLEELFSLAEGALDCLADLERHRYLHWSAETGIE
jgi:hypothetical protein